MLNFLVELLLDLRELLSGKASEINLLALLTSSHCSLATCR